MTNAVVVASGRMPGARYALNIVHARSPVLRIRYRDGVLVDPYGFPDWLLYARALVQAPPPTPGLTLGEMRMLDILAANAAMVTQGDDPLWDDTLSTPHGWCWAHVGGTRRLALVPIELHGSYRHGGGVRTMAAAIGMDRSVRGDGAPLAAAPFDTAHDNGVPEDILDDLDRIIGTPLPAPYRSFLARTNGAAPTSAAVLPGHSFVMDQPLFGVARRDPHQDIAFARDWLTDRFSPDLLPIGYVQGGMLALSLTGDDAGSVWFWDDDDPRDDDGFGSAKIRERLLWRCASRFDDFLAHLAPPPAPLVERAADQAESGQIMVVREELAGAGLPATMRAPWQPPPAKGRDPVIGLFELS